MQDQSVSTEPSTPSVETPKGLRAKTWDQLSYSERSELKALSKEVFGSSSRVQKLIEKGHTELLTTESEEIKPPKDADDKSTDEERTVKTKIPLLRSDGAKQSSIKRYDTDSVRAYLLERKRQLDEFKAHIKKMQDEAAAKKEAEELAKRIHEELQGSAV